MSYIYSIEREIEKRENRVRERAREREKRGRKDKWEKIENFEIFYLIHLNMKKFHGGLGRRRRERKKVTSSSTEKTHTLKKEKFLIKG